MTATWPKANKRLIDDQTELQFDRLKAVVVAIRNIRAEVNVPLESRPPVALFTHHASRVRSFKEHERLMQALARVGSITVAEKGLRPKGAAMAVIDGMEILIPLADLINAERERARLKERVEDLTKQRAQLEARLRDKQFVSKAPKDVVAQTKERRQQLEETLKKVHDHLAVLESL